MRSRVEKDFSSMGTRQISPIDDPRWAAFLETHPAASIFHTPGWLQALRLTYGYEPVVMTTASAGEALGNGLVFCRVKSWLTGSRAISLPFSDHCEPLVESPDVLDCILSGCRRDLAQTRSRYLEIRPISAAAKGSKALSEGRRFCLHQLDLRPSLKDLFNGFHKDCVQRKILRAEREAVHYEDGRSEALLDQFYHLMILTRRRQRLAPQPRSWFLNLICGMGDALKIRLASKSGRPVAAALTLRHRDALVYKYGCSDHTFNNLGGMQLVLWRTIQEAKADGLSRFDLGRSDWDNSGLISFKDRWGAKRSEITYFRLSSSKHSMPVCAPSVSDWKFRLAKKVSPHLPERVLCAAAALIYRHIG